MENTPHGADGDLNGGTAPSSPIDYLKLGLVCAAVALAVVVGWTLMQRSDADGDPQVEEKSVKKSEGKQPKPVASITLATEPAELTNEELQSELLAEIDTLLDQFDQNPQAMHVAASAYDKIHQTNKATELWKECIRLEPRHVGPLLGLAKLLSETGKDTEAVTLLQQSLDDGVQSAELYYRLATAHSKVGEVERAEEVMKAGVRDFPQIAINWLLLGQTQNQLQKFEEAETSLRTSLQLDDSGPQVYFALANACQRQGKTEEAAEFRKQFSDMKKAETEAGRDRPFQDIYQQALRPVVVGAFASAAAVYSTHDDAAKAEDLFLRANALEPDNPQVLVELGRVYRNNEQWANAQLVQRRLVELDPDNAIYQINLANLAAQSGDWQAAEAALATARTLWPDNPLPFIGSAQIQIQLGNLQLARQYAEHAVERGPSPQAYALLAAICQQLGDTDAAQAAQRRVYQAIPGGR